jgi:hypothetical protein
MASRSLRHPIRDYSCDLFFARMRWGRKDSLFLAGRIGIALPNTSATTVGGSYQTSRDVRRRRYKLTRASP